MLSIILTQISSRHFAHPYFPNQDVASAVHHRIRSSIFGELIKEILKYFLQEKRSGNHQPKILEYHMKRYRQIYPAIYYKSSRTTEAY
jgi:hypothetical protein